MALAFNEVLGQEFFDVVVGTGAPQIDQIRLQDPLLQGNGGQGAEGGGGEVHRQQVLNKIAQSIAQLEAVALAFLSDFQGRIPMGVVGHQGDQTQIGFLAADRGDFGQFPEGERPALEIENRLHARRQRQRRNRIGRRRGHGRLR